MSDTLKLLMTGALSFLIFLGMLVLLGWLISTATQASAHDAAHETDWIGQEGIVNGMGQMCCGANDCTVIPPEHVHALPDGLHIHVRAHIDDPKGDAHGTGRDEEWDEIWDYKDVIANPMDGKTYRCGWPTPKDQKCLISGLPGS